MFRATFGIVTSGSPESQGMIDRVVESIERENIPEYEILVIGNYRGSPNDRVRVLPFDESVKPKWITRKKNIVTEQAKYENVVYMHDYVALEPGWYEGWERFGDFSVAMNPIVNSDGSRYRDWTLWAFDVGPSLSAIGGKGPTYLLPYEETSLSKYMYFSGAYWVAKKDVMTTFPLDERLSWGEGEDVEWSKRVRGKHDFSINTRSRVKLLKNKDRVFEEISDEVLVNLKDTLGI